MALEEQNSVDAGGSEMMPQHVAIIMDGNGRWAAQRGLPRAEGHRRGVEAVRRCVRAAIELGIPYLTIYSFSSENWSRPEAEINDLMGLLKRFIRRDLADLHKNGVAINVVGSREGLEPEIVSLLSEGEQLTKNNTRLNLTVAFNYGSRAEIAKAAQDIARDVEAGRLTSKDVTVDLLASRLETHGVPDPDLLIRTSGEQRLSNFLLWQLAYAEFVFIDEFWPDFDKAVMERAIRQFQDRERRFGGLQVRSTA